MWQGLRLKKAPTPPDTPLHLSPLLQCLAEEECEPRALLPGNSIEIAIDSNPETSV